MSEEKLALAITQYLQRVLPEDAVDFHVPNEGRRSRWEQSQFLAAGGKAGIPDRWILWNGHAWCWEEKSDDGGLSASQKKMFPRIEAAGFPVPIVRSLDDAERCLAGWGIPLRGVIAARSPQAGARPRTRTLSAARSDTA